MSVENVDRLESLDPVAGDATAGDCEWEARIGDYVVYPGHGVALIVERSRQEIAGESADFFVLRMVEDDSRILIPQRKLRDVGLRPVMGDEDAERIWRILRRRSKPTAQGVTWSRQFRAYQDKVRTGTVFDVAEVLRDLLRLQGTKELSFGEHRLLESARSLVVQELAAAQTTEAADVEREIRDAVR